MGAGRQTHLPAMGSPSQTRDSISLAKAFLGFNTSDPGGWEIVSTTDNPKGNLFSKGKFFQDCFCNWSRPVHIQHFQDNLAPRGTRLSSESLSKRVCLNFPLTLRSEFKMFIENSQDLSILFPYPLFQVLSANSWEGRTRRLRTS